MASFRCLEDLRACTNHYFYLAPKELTAKNVFPRAEIGDRKISSIRLRKNYN